MPVWKGQNVGDKVRDGEWRGMSDTVLALRDIIRALAFNVKD